MPLPLRVVIVQALVGVCLVLVMGLSGAEQALAAAAGSAAVLIPGLLFALVTGRVSEPRQLIGLGAAKLVLTITLLVVVLAGLKPEALGFFVGLIGQYLTFAVASWWLPTVKLAGPAR